MRFKIVNIGLIICLAINFIISYGIVEMFAGEKKALAFWITLGIFICSIGILFTPVGDWWYRRIVYHLREPNGMEAKRLTPIYEEVYKRAMDAVPNLPEDIRLFIYDDDNANAMAIGRKTIAVYRGMLTNHIYDDEIAAALAHEFAHIANGDTVCTILAFQSNILVSVFKSLLMFGIKILAVICGFFISIVGDSEQGSKNIFTIVEAAGRGLAWLVEKFIALIVAIGVIIAQSSRRKHELEADSFAAELGYRQPMLRFFQRYGENESRHTLSFAELMYGTHPSMEKRIENLLKQTSY